MIQIQEHQKIEPGQLLNQDLDRLKRRINYDTSCFDAAKLNLIRYEFDPSPAFPKDGFYSYFRIGAEWLDEDMTIPLVVVPKIAKIDFLDMFMTCLSTSSPDDNFSSIYDIDLDAKPIRSTVLNSILSPLLVVQFLMILKKISERGLRRGYVSRAENLNKVRGRIDFRKNEIRNVLTAHKERLYCRYDEFSVDTPENRYLKRALRIASNMISLMKYHQCYSALYALCRQCLSAFDDVPDSYDDFVSFTRMNELFSEYDDALRFARMIIRKEELAINSRYTSSFDVVPVFRIDMALLFEHYVLAKLRDAFGRNNVLYQVRGSNPFVADFLIKKGRLKVVADAKYTEIYNDGATKGDYIKQLCGYARDTGLLRKLDIACKDEDSVPIVSCALIYPGIKNQNDRELNLLKFPSNRTVKYYTTKVDIPII